MPLIMKFGGGGPTIRYNPVQLAGFYLSCARKSAAAALAIGDGADRLEERIEPGILTVIWATLALEAGAHQVAEGLFSPENVDDFCRCRKSFQIPKGVSRTVWKWHKLFAAGPKVDIALSDPVLIAAECLVKARNGLSHYRLQDASQKVYFQPEPPVVWSAYMPPTKVEPSLVEKELLGDKPREHFLAAWTVFYRWELAYGRDVAEFEKVVPHL
jgi:hypothetical protein